MLIHGYTDAIMKEVCRRLQLEIPPYDAGEDPTKRLAPFPPAPALTQPSASLIQEWTIPFEWLKDMERTYQARLKTKVLQSKGAKVESLENS